MDYSRIQKGLKLTIIGYFFVIFSALFSLIGLYVGGFAVVGGILAIVALVLEIIGIILLGVSGSSYFKKAFYTLLGTIIGAILVVILSGINASGMAGVIAIFSFVLTIADLLFLYFMVRGCTDVSSSSMSAKLGKYIFALTGISIICSLISIIFAFADNVTAVNVVGTIDQIATILASVLFVVLLVHAYKTIKE